MDFARKQLEKYGWSDGKGLGKHGNGIPEALKPKIKRSVAGIGHDPAADFTEHWWSALYDKASDNVQVKEKNGETKKIRTKDDKFQITNSTYHLKKKSKKHKPDSGTEEYSDFFVKTAVLDGVKTEKIGDACEEEEVDEKEKKDVLKMTDEELFAACEGRTAHKGARHGLKALGKLARIQRQEQLLLTQPQFKDYSHAKRKTQKDLKLKVDSEVIENSNTGCKDATKKKSKRKHCSGDEIGEISSKAVETQESVPENASCKIKKLKRDTSLGSSETQKSENESSKIKKLKCVASLDCSESVSKSKSSKVKKESGVDSDSILKHKKNKKHRWSPT